MKIGVPRECKPGERRVALTPAAARDLAATGHELLVESGAGAGSGFQDADYESAGARLVSTEDAWGAELVLKVKEPTAGEYGFFREGLVLFTYLHLAADGPLTDALVAAGVTGDRLRDGHRPQRRRAAAAGADERDRRPARRPGGRVLPGGLPRRRRRAARPRRRRPAGARGGDRRRHGRLPRRRRLARPRRPRHRVRHVGGAAQPPRRGDARPDRARGALPRPAGGDAVERRPRGRRRARPRRPRARGRRP